jgi:hypothetical protein
MPGFQKQVSLTGASLDYAENVWAAENDHQSALLKAAEDAAN